MEEPMDLSFFPRDLFSELDRLQRQVQEASAFSPSIRGLARGGFPAINVGTTGETAEIFAFAPGLDPSKIDVYLERGVLSISGERAASGPAKEEGKAASVHIKERFAGRFHRVVTLSEDLDPESVDAKYRDGILQISIKRSAASKPRRINVN
jgi:HSP20 family protein